MVSILYLGDDWKEFHNIKLELSDRYRLFRCSQLESINTKLVSLCPEIVLINLSFVGIDSSKKLINILINHDPSPGIILIGRDYKPDDIIPLIKNGAYDYLSVPVDFNRMKKVMNRLIISRYKPEDQINSGSSILDDFIGDSHRIYMIKKQIIKIINSDLNIFISGEEGTGKTTLARLIHKMQFGLKSPFVQINCGVVSAEDLDTILFGKKAGGQILSGFMEFSECGTLLLKDIGLLSFQTQNKLIKALDDGLLFNTGKAESEKKNIRLIVSDRNGLETAAEEGRFRTDLLYRLNVLNFHLPPLKDRPDDIPIIAKAMLKKINREKKFSLNAVEKILNYSWPGNLRQLDSVLKRAVVLSGEFQEIESSCIFFK